MVYTSHKDNILHVVINLIIKVTDKCIVGVDMLKSLEDLCGTGIQ